MSTEIAEELSRQTRGLVSRFEARADAFRGRHDLSGLVVPVDVPGAEEFGRNFFGTGEHVATGIDGSMDFDERLQMILFYSNATAYSYPFTVGEHLKFDLPAARRDSKLAASAAVPLWGEDLGSVFSNEPEVDIELEHSMDRIPNSFMTLGELHLALRACEKSKLVFLDRPLSGTFSTLSRDERNLLKRGESKLVRWGSGHGVSLLDIDLAVNLGSPAMTVPTRSRFLPLAVVRLLMAGPKGFGELAASLRVDESEVRRAAKRVRNLDSRHGNALLADSSASGQAQRGCFGLLEPCLRALARLRERRLRREETPARPGQRAVPHYSRREHRGPIPSRYALPASPRDRRTPDRHSEGHHGHGHHPGGAPIRGLIRLHQALLGPPRLKNDRAFLAILSSENPSIKTPWRTMSYDSSYSTIVDINGRFVSARKVVSREKLFARSFFQLRTLKTDPSIRSQVFLFDRLYNEEFDSPGVRRFEVEEKRGGETQLDAYFEGRTASPLSNLVLHILSLNDNPEVFEAFGHNQLLYLADKAVKAEVRMLRGSLRGIADLRVGGVSRRTKIFGLATTYRQQRAEAEHARMRQ